MNRFTIHNIENGSIIQELKLETGSKVREINGKYVIYFESNKPILIIEPYQVYITVEYDIEC